VSPAAIDYIRQYWRPDGSQASSGVGSEREYPLRSQLGCLGEGRTFLASQKTSGGMIASQENDKIFGFSRFSPDMIFSEKIGTFILATLATQQVYVQILGAAPFTPQGLTPLLELFLDTCGSPIITL